MDDALAFEPLRDSGLGAVQKHARRQWSDYNVHDPGLAILEQICFALTELAHRADFPVEDLLADESGAVALEALGLDPPAEALPTRPVTAADIAAALVDRCAHVRRVFLRPREAAAERGLWDLFVAPATEAEAGQALAEVRAAFEAQRNLCEDIGLLRLAKPVRCRLVAEVEVRRRSAPERLAATIYERCRRLMEDAAEREDEAAPTPAAAFDAPETLFGARAAREGATSMDQFHRAVTAIEGVERVVALRFEAAHGGGDPFAAPLAFGRYRALAVPTTRAEAGLRLTSRGIDVAYDPAAMRAEFSRLRSRRAMEGARPRDETLWRPRIRGRRRSFVHTRLGEGFPRAFHVGADAPAAALPEEARAAALQLRGYLALADAPLSDAAGDLEALPRLFAVSDDDGASYAARPLDFGPTPELARGTEAAARAAAARHDPWRERKGRALDYLLALRGEAFSQNSLRRFDACHTGEARELRILRNRVRLLREAAALDRDRAAAPDRIAPPARAAPSAEAAPTEGAAPSEGPGRRKRAAAGAARRIAILLDFPDRGDVALDAVLRGLKLALTEASAPDDPGRVARASLRAPENPLDAAPRARAEREPIDAQTLIRDTAFLARGALPVSAFRRGALIDSYALTEAGAGWAVHLDDGDPETALFCAALASRDAAELRANSLALLFETLNASTEGVTLVEDVALRGCVRGFAPLTVHAVFGGVSLRAADPGFRRLAEETARLSLPAHLAVRPRWLGPDGLGRFDALHRAWRAAARRAHAPEGADEAERAAAALAAFLRAEPAP